MQWIVNPSSFRPSSPPRGASAVAGSRATPEQDDSQVPESLRRQPHASHAIATPRLGSLASVDSLAAASSAIGGLLAAFKARHRKELTPSWRRAAWWLSTRLGVAATGHVVAAGALGRDAWPAALPALALGSMATGSLLVVVHDLAHGTFFPSRRANRIAGHVLAALFFVDFGAFLRAHLAHHRAPQSPEDPNFAFIESSAIAPDNAAGVSQAGSQRQPAAAVLACLRLTQRLPCVLRTLLYVLLIVLTYPILLLGSKNELTLWHRDFRDRRRWLPFAAPFLFYASLWLLWPALAACVFLGAWVSLVATLMLVLPHYLEEQLVFRAPIARNVAALNASDVRFGPVRWFTGGISDYHAAHHLDCSVPIYALPRLGSWVDAELGRWKAAPVAAADWRLLPRFVDCVLRFSCGRQGHDWRLDRIDGREVVAHCPEPRSA